MWVGGHKKVLNYLYVTQEVGFSWEKMPALTKWLNCRQQEELVVDELIVGFSKRFSGGSHSSGHERLKKWKNNFIRCNTQELWTIVIWALPLSFPAAQFIFNKGFIWSFVRNYVLMVTPNLEKKIALIRVWHVFLIPHLLRNIKHSSKCQNNKK